MRNIIRRTTFLALILALAMVVGCGNHGQVTDSHEPGTYDSSEEAISAIKSFMGDTGTSTQQVLAAPSSGQWHITQTVDNDQGAEIELTIPGVAEEIDFDVEPDSMSMDGQEVDEVDISMTVFVDVVDLEAAGSANDAEQLPPTTLASQALNAVLGLLQQQYDYLDQLSTTINDPSGKWGKDGERKNLRDKSEDAREKSDEAREEFDDSDFEDAIEEIEDALDELEELSEKAAKYLDEEELGQVAHDEVQQQTATVEEQLNEAIAQLNEALNAGSSDDDDEEDRYVATLNFEFGPSGLQFDPYAELEISFEMIVGLDLDALEFESESEGDIEGVSYDIDWEDEELEIYVPHFSQYYLNRR